MSERIHLAICLVKEEMRTFFQRNHIVSTLSDQSALRLCQLTNTNNIRSLFEPLNKERVVGTSGHKAAGQVNSTLIARKTHFVERKKAQFSLWR